MAEPIKDQIKRKVEDASILYHRLVLLAAPPGSGKTRVLQDVSESLFAPRINVNLELSKQMLDLTERQRVLQLPRILQGMVAKGEGNLVILDNTEILFDVSLKQDPLRLLQGLSRNKTIVAAWNGSVEGDYLIYAMPGHPEYKRYSIQDLLIVHQVSAL